MEAIEHDHMGKSLHKSHGYNTRNKVTLNIHKAFGQQYRSSLLVKGTAEFAKWYSIIRFICKVQIIDQKHILAY